MSENLYPFFDVPDIVDSQTAELSIYHPSLLFNFETGEFEITGTGQMIYSDEKEAFRQWCIKMIKTERRAHLAYSDDLGVELDEAVRAGPREAIESEIERTITEALSVHERTESVSDFEFEFAGDEVKVKFIVEAEQIGSIPIETEIEGG